MICTPRRVCQEWLLVGNQFKTVVLGMKLFGVFTLIHKDKRLSITSPLEKPPDSPNFTWNFRAYIQKSLLNQIHLENMQQFFFFFFFSYWFSLSYFLKTLKLLLLIGPVYINYTCFYPCIYSWWHMAGFTLWLSKGNGLSRVFEKRKTRYSLV